MRLYRDPEAGDGGGGPVDDGDEASVIASVVASAGKDPSSLESKGEVKPQQALSPAEPVAAPVVEEPAAPAEPTVAEIKAEMQKLKDEIAQFRTAPRVDAPAAPQKPQKTWTPRAVVRAEDVDKLIVGGEETTAYLNQLLDDLREDFAGLTMQYVDMKMNPVEQDRTTAEIERRTGEFKEKHKDLGEWVDVAREQAGILMQELHDRGIQFPDWPKFYDMVAERTRPIVDTYKKRLNPAASGNGGVNPPPPSTPQGGSVRKAAKTGPNSALQGTIEDKEEAALIEAVVRGSY